MRKLLARFLRSDLAANLGVIAIYWAMFLVPSLVLLPSLKGGALALILALFFGILNEIRVEVRDSSL
jgi:hypothetical protein